MCRAQPMLVTQDCEILKLDKNYRGELFPRELDNSALTVYMNVSILAFPKVILVMVTQVIINVTMFQIDTLQLYFTTDFILTMRWRDPRLDW